MTLDIVRAAREKFLSTDREPVEWGFEDAQKYLNVHRLPTGRNWDGHEPLPPRSVKLKRTRRRAQKHVWKKRS